MLSCLALVPWIFVMMGFRNKAVTARPKPAQRRAILSQALKSHVFWTIALGFSAIAIAVSALVVHMVPLLRDAGMAPLQAAAVASFTGLGVLLGRIVIGWLIDHFFAPFVAAAVFTLTALGCLLLAYGGPQTAPFAAFLIGFSLGAEVDLISYLTARYFGMAAYGVLYAMIYAFFVVGASVGPVLAGRTFDMTGNYSLAIWMVIGLLMTGASAILTLPRFDAVPAKPDTSPASLPPPRWSRTENPATPSPARPDHRTSSTKKINEARNGTKSSPRGRRRHSFQPDRRLHGRSFLISYTGEGLQRPECILAARDGSLWAADARGGVVHIFPDGSQQLVTQRAETTFASATDDETRFIAGTLPNGLAFARNGDVVISNFGTDRLEVMTRDGETRVLVNSIDGEPIGKVNFVLRDSRDRLWLTISTRTKNWMRAISPCIADGYIALYDQGRLRIVADGFHFTNEIRLDAREEWLYVAETTARRITRLRVRRTAASPIARSSAPPTTEPSSTVSPSTPTAISAAPPDNGPHLRHHSGGRDADHSR